MGIRDRIDLRRKTKKAQKNWEKHIEEHFRKQGIEMWE